MTDAARRVWVNLGRNAPARNVLQFCIMRMLQGVGCSCFIRTRLPRASR